MHTVIAASSVILRHEGRYLLVERARGTGTGQFAFPGGRADAGETPEATARRELREETGLEAGRLNEYARFRIEVTGDIAFLLTVFTGDHDGRGTAIAADDAASLRWVTAAESLHLNMPPSVHACIAALEKGVPLPNDCPELVAVAEAQPR